MQNQNNAANVIVSENELTLVKAIAAEGRKLGIDITSTAVERVNPFENKYIGAGTYASAMKKGLVKTQDYGTVNHAVYLTPLGLEISKRRKA